MGYSRLIKIYPNPANPGQYMTMVAVHPSSYAEAEKDNVPVCWRYKRVAYTNDSRYLPGECSQPSNNELFRAITNTQNAVTEAAKRAQNEMAMYDNQMRSPEYQAVSKNMDATSDKVVALLNQADERLAAGDKKGYDELTARANALERDNEANHKEWLAPMDQRLAACEKNIAFCDLTSDLYEIKSTLMGNRSYAAPAYVNQNDTDWYTRDLNPKTVACDEVWIESALVQSTRKEVSAKWHPGLGLTFSEYMVKRVEEIKDDLRQARDTTLAIIEPVEEPYSHKYLVGGGPDYWQKEIYGHAQYEFYQESLPLDKRDPTYVSDKDRHEASQKQEMKEKNAVMETDDLTQEEMDYIDEPDSEPDSEPELDSDQGEVYDGSDSEPEPEVKSKPVNQTPTLDPAQDPTMEPFQYLTVSTDGGWKAVTSYIKKTN